MVHLDFLNDIILQRAARKGIFHRYREAVPRWFCLHFGTLCKGYSSVQGCAGGNADKHTFLGCDESACRKSILVRYGDDFFIDFGIQYLRNKAGADSLNFVRAGSAGG